jgi:hypothetical protein
VPPVGPARATGPARRGRARAGRATAGETSGAWHDMARRDVMEVAKYQSFQKSSSPSPSVLKKG